MTEDAGPDRTRWIRGVIAAVALYLGSLRVRVVAAGSQALVVAGKMVALSAAVAFGVSVGMKSLEPKPTVISINVPPQLSNVTASAGSNKPCGCGQTPTPIAGGPTPSPIASPDVPKKPLIAVPVVPVEAVFRR